MHCSCTALIKVDMLADANRGLVKRIDLPDTMSGGEASFVPRDADAMLRGECDEDDGWLVMYATDYSDVNKLCSSCMVCSHSLTFSCGWHRGWNAVIADNFWEASKAQC
jgi:carotenoid cleavage dioxygenase-like enzyme